MSIGKQIGLWILGIVVAVVLAGVLGFVDLGFTKFFGTQKANIQHDIQKNNTAYIEGAASDLAHYKYELTQQKDSAARKAIIDLIVHDYGNLDPNKLENADLRDFLRQVLNGEIQ